MFGSPFGVGVFGCLITNNDGEIASSKQVAVHNCNEKMIFTGLHYCPQWRCGLFPNHLGDDNKPPPVVAPNVAHDLWISKTLHKIQRPRSAKKF